MGENTTLVMEIQESEVRPPHPFGEIKSQTGGTIIAKEIYTVGNQGIEVEARIKKAPDTWGEVDRVIFRKKAIGPRIKILLWSSLIRRTTKYGLRTKDLPRYLLNRMDAYVRNHLRALTRPK